MFSIKSLSKQNDSTMTPIFQTISLIKNNGLKKIMDKYAQGFLIKTLYSNGIHLSDKLKIDTRFNTFFSTIATDLDSIINCQILHLHNMFVLKL